jgi:hypothetical protein
MGTYTKPELIKNNMFGEALKQMRSGTQALMAGAQAGAKLKQTKEQAAAAKKAKEDKEFGKTAREIDISWNKGAFSTKSVDQKHNQFVRGMLDAGYTPQLVNNPEARRDYYASLKQKAGDTQSLITYLNKDGDLINDMYTFDASTGNLTAKVGNMDGANLATNDGKRVDALIDYRFYGGAHGEFYDEGDTYGYRYSYPIVNGERMRWNEWENTPDGKKITDLVNQTNQANLAANKPLISVEDVLRSGTYSVAAGTGIELGQEDISANGVNPKVASGAKFLQVYSSKDFNGLMKNKWNQFGQTLYKQNSGGGTSSKTVTIGQNGQEITSKVVSYEKDNEAIRERYLNNMYNLDLDQNTYAGLGFKGKFDPTNPQQVFEAASKMADMSIALNGKASINSRETSKDQATINRDLVAASIPGFARNWEMTMNVPDPNNPGYTTTAFTDPGEKMRQAAAAGTIPQPTNGGEWGTGDGGAYSLEDMKVIAEYMVPGQGQVGNELTDFAQVLSIMTPIDGRSYGKGDDLKESYRKQYEKEYVIATGLNPGPTDTFFNWLAGEIVLDSSGNKVVPFANPVYGVKNIQDQKLYRTSSNYLEPLNVNSPQAALQVMLSEADISKQNARTFEAQLYGKAAQAQVNTNKKSSSKKAKTGNQVATGTGTYATQAEADAALANDPNPGSKSVVALPSGKFVIQ